jgi:RHS repeat-associated protein
MTVAGQLQVTYSYDNANRLTQIAQGTSTVGFSYDTANRRSTLTLSNGVNMSYTYDNDSRVTGITYKFNGNTLGNLTYAYDSLGRRTQVGGSFAQTGLPGTVTSAMYDAANELTNWNGTPISYDLNGNMLSDGTNAFTWNARNQVTSLNSVSLQYDAFGRRIANPGGVSSLYDGLNTVQDIAGTAVNTNFLNGGTDEILIQTDSAASTAQLRDALGSTIALIDNSGNIVATYSYDPFGSTAVGQSNMTRFQYTGRENDGNNLYYLRNRYYNSHLGRFTSEDPARAGENFYSYADDDPVDFNDPLGLRPQKPHHKPKPANSAPVLAGRYVPALKLRVTRDCFDPGNGVRVRVYDLVTPDGRSPARPYWVTEQQTNFELAPPWGQSTDPKPNVFHDMVGWPGIIPERGTAQSQQYFLVSADRASLENAFRVDVEERDGTDYGVLGIWMSKNGGNSTVNVLINGRHAPVTCADNTFTF